MENILDVAGSVKGRIFDEFSKGLSNRAVGRVLCEDETVQKEYFLTNKTNEGLILQKGITGNITGIGYSYTTSDVGISVYKNTRLGEALIGKIGEKVKYKAPRGEKSIRLLDRAIYSPFGEDAIDVQISLADDPSVYFYQKLSDLLVLKTDAEVKLREQQERLEKLKEEQEKIRRQEEEARAKQEEEERIRLEQERLRKEEEERKRKEEIAQMEANIAAVNEKINQQKASLRKNVMLRSQHILDPYQEKAKRSHVYDGVPVVIDGGPGTGKTTTVIQRLKFLLSKVSLEEYGAPLTKEQLETFADPHKWSLKWLFFSPTDLLLQYLKNNMQEEELIVTESNARTIERFRQSMLRDYGIWDPNSSKFKLYKDKSASSLIKDPKAVIEQFERFCIDFIKDSVKKIIDFDTSEYSWKNYAGNIKGVCRRFEISDRNTLIRLLIELNNLRPSYAAPVEEELRLRMSESAMSVKRLVCKNEEVVEKVKALFERWKKEAKMIGAAEEEPEDNEDSTEEDVENQEAETIDFDTELYTNVRKILRNLGLKKIDSKAKFSKHQTSLYELIESFMPDDDELIAIGEHVLFSKNFTAICRGPESLFINRIPQLYKMFRKDALEKKNDSYNLELLEKVIKRDSNRLHHVDEQNLILGFINNLLYSSSKFFKKYFLEMKGKTVKAYKDNCRPIIGIDEATDYSLLDYYCMISFRYYEYSSITLSGDLMQGLRNDGIKDWNELKVLFPELDVVTLNVSYRQSPTLVDMAKELYRDTIGEYPSYSSNKQKMDNEAKPILYVSDDAYEKTLWIAKRIVEIYNEYGQSLPSIAIFVGDDVDVEEFVENVQESLNGIEVVDCTSGKLDNKEVVRVFRLTAIKGMEFEAAFFYDIDTATQNHSEELMKKHLYVGVSRAASHLAATMTTTDGNESVSKYFETEEVYW